jgi:DNA-binding NtrC family response regulator
MRSGGRQKTTQVRNPSDPQRSDESALAVLFSPDPAVRGRVARLGREPLRVGRDVGPADLTVDDPMVSRLHASVSWDPVGECHVVRDEGSRNGTELGGLRVTSEVLHPGDIVRVGDTVLWFGPFELGCVGWAAPPESPLKGRSGALQRLLGELRRVAPTGLSVLVRGETGTGKELVARELHRLSGRGGPFVELNCAALPAELFESELFGYVKGSHSGADHDQKGLVQSAERGTLFLDEVGELAPAVQAKLLRVLDDKCVRPVGAARPVPVDVRFVCATNRDLGAAVQGGTFRADLYARLNQWELEAPPLRDRPEDLLPIVEETIRLHGGRRPYALSGDFFAALALYDWPLNVRELVTIVKRALVRLSDGGTLAAEHLPADLRVGGAAGAGDGGGGGGGVGGPLPPRDRAVRPAELVRLLQHYGGNVSEVARHTGRDRNQVYRWLRRAGLDPDDYRAE